MEIKQNLKIEIRPIPNRNKIQDFSSNLEYFSQSHTIHPFVDGDTRRYRTGLSDEDIKYLKENNFPYDLSDQYIRGVAHPFWESFAVKMELINRPMFLYPGRDLLDFVKYKYLLVNDYIYKSEAEMLSGSKPQATHYIYNEEEEIEIKATKLEKEMELTVKIKELSLQRKRDIISILLDESTENKNDSYLTVKFSDILNNKDLSKQLEILLNAPVKEISLQAEIKSAILKNVLRLTKQGIFYFETNLGYSEQEVMEELAKPDNQELYLNIKSKL